MWWVKAPVLGCSSEDLDRAEDLQVQEGFSVGGVEPCDVIGVLRAEGPAEAEVVLVSQDKEVAVVE